MINEPITGVVSINSLNQWFVNDVFQEGIDLDFECFMKELESQNLTEEEIQDQLDMYESYEPTYLIGDWKKDENGLYEPDETGEYSAIVSFNQFNCVQVVYSKHIAKVHSMCSPCFPNQADLDSGDGEIYAYTLPKEWFEIED